MDRKWKLVLAFIAGTIFGEVAADPSDYIFFQLRQSMTAEQAVAAWYFLTAAFYAAIFIAAYIIARTGIVKPEDFITVMMGLVAVSVALTYNLLVRQGADPNNLVFLLGVPLMAGLGLLYSLRKSL